MNARAVENMYQGALVTAMIILGFDVFRQVRAN